LQLSIEHTATPRRVQAFFTGGKSGRSFGGFNPHLGGGLKGPSSEIPKQIANRLLRAIDQMPVGGVIDRVSHLQHRRLKILTHPPNQFLTIQLAQAIHGKSPSGHPCPETI
jgi:hypothetical protein